MEARDMKKDCQTAKWGEAGVTLIEAVIALTILAVMGVIALEAMRLGYRTWEKTERRADADQRLRVMHDLLVHEFSRLEPVTISRSSTCCARASSGKMPPKIYSPICGCPS